MILFFSIIIRKSRKLFKDESWQKCRGESLESLILSLMSPTQIEHNPSALCLRPQGDRVCNLLQPDVCLSARKCGTSTKHYD